MTSPMTERWYYTHNRQSHGPLSRAEINLLATRGLLTPQDLVWREGADRKTAVQASTVVDFAPARPQSGPLPNWLSDVAAAERTKPRPVHPPLAPFRPSAPPPSWLEDVRFLGGELPPRELK